MWWRKEFKIRISQQLAATYKMIMDVRGLSFNRNPSLRHYPLQPNCANAGHLRSDTPPPISPTRFG